MPLIAPVRAALAELDWSKLPDLARKTAELRDHRQTEADDVSQLN
jgi:hypothetical protein